MLFTTEADKSNKCVMSTGLPGRFGSAPGLFVGITFCATQSITAHVIILDSFICNKASDSTDKETWVAT